MAKAIETGTIGEDLRSQPDQIWTAEALPNTTTKTSGEFKLGQTMGGVEVKVKVVAGATLAGDVTVELQTSAVSGSGYATKVSKTTIATTVLATGDDLAGLILPREVCDELYAVIKITTAGADQAVTVDAYPVFVS
jgi:hypothetical protein